MRAMVMSISNSVKAREKVAGKVGRLVPKTPGLPFGELKTENFTGVAFRDGSLSFACRGNYWVVVVVSQLPMSSAVPSVLSRPLEKMS